MMTRQIECRCGASVDVPPNQVGRVTCPSCRKVIPLTPPITIPTYSPRAGETDTPPRSHVPETIIHRCPACGKPSRVLASMAGRPVRCPHCKQPGTVTASDRAETTSPLPAAGAVTPAPESIQAPETDRPVSRPADAMAFATETEAPLGEEEPSDEPAGTPSGRRKRTTSGLHRRPAGASGIHRRPTSVSGRTRAMARTAPSGQFPRKSAAGLDPVPESNKTLWLVLGGGVVVLLFFLVAALVFLIKTNG